MIFEPTALAGVYLIGEEPHYDERGFFARTWCQKEFAEHGLNPRLAQCNVSFNAKKGTWRGMHYQVPPHEEAKVVKCIAGAVCDVIVDLRPDSPTFKKHLTVTLSARNRKMLYIPEKFAHGFLTLEDRSEILYQMSEFHAPQSARGFRWNDPEFGIQLPLEVAVISDRDASYPDFAAHAWA